ncbi:MAG: adenosylmethionine decarboxylase [bacterium]|nr:adenosylmethionine decarboxylase [bacterium]
MHFGEHLTIDGYGGDKQKLNDKELVLRCLDELPGLLGMRKIAEPQLVVFPGNEVKDPGGVSGIVMIAESHISIHTFTERRFLTADVYSCRNNMDTVFIIDYFTKQFGLQDVEQNFLKRGTRYPEHNIA